MTVIESHERWLAFKWRISAFCAASPFLQSSHYIWSREIRSEVHRREVFIWVLLYQSSSEGLISPHHRAEISPFFHTANYFFSPFGWLTKYYLHYPATLISPPWCQVLMTQVRDGASVHSTAVQCSLSGWLSCQILNLGVCSGTNITTGAKKTSA